MKQKEEKETSRRKFLQLAATVVGAGALTGGSTVIYQMTRPTSRISETFWRLNPAFRIKELSADAVELYTQLANSEVLRHRFRGLEADLLRQLVNEQAVDAAIPSLSEKHHLSVQDCQKEVDQTLKEFLKANLIYMGEKIPVKIQEAKNG